MNQKNNTNYQQCKRCLMDTADSEISFDGQGNCNHCNHFLGVLMKKTYQGLSSDILFKKRIEEIKNSGKGKNYDCVVGISGGVDSCYVAHICKKAGLKALLVHLDNGWDSETSVSNIEVICKNLELDYVSKVLNWVEFREIQLSHLKASVPEIETPTDIAILEELHKTADEYGIKHIILGGNYITEGILPKSWHYNAKDKKFSKAIHKQFSSVKVKKFPSFDFIQEFYYKYFKGIKIHYILNDYPFNKKQAIETLEKIGWKRYGQKHHESFYTRLVQSYILPLKFNIDYRKAILSTKICIGEISKETAVEMMAQLPYNEITIEDDLNYVCKKLGITREEFESIMKDKPKSYKDYPNNKFILEFLYKVYLTLGSK